MIYNEYKYLFPPRPENKISSDQLSKYDTGLFVGQPKYDGTNTLVFLDGKNFLKIMNRHNEDITNPFISEIDYKGIHRGKGFMILCGELLNKNKIGENGEPFNKRLILWDILCYEGNYLVGTSTLDRLKLLEELYSCNRMQATREGIEMFEHICCTTIKGVYKAPTYLNGFEDLYNELVKVPLFEGLVLKRKEAKLSYGYAEKNNSDWMLKCRKETKNYKF